MIKYKLGYEHLYKKYPIHYRNHISNKIPTRILTEKDEKWLYCSYPPEDNEINWYFWFKFHNRKLQTDLEFCQTCNKLLNPERNNQSYLLTNIIRTKDRFTKIIVCSECRIIEDKIRQEFEEIAIIKRKMRKIIQISRKNVKINDKIVKSMPKNSILWDEEVKGFIVRRQFSDKKTFSVVYRTMDRIQRWQKIGYFGIFTTALARKEAIRILIAVSLGMDPGGLQKEIKNGKSKGAKNFGRYT
jgi:hypothetical protein